MSAEGVAKTLCQLVERALLWLPRHDSRDMWVYCRVRLQSPDAENWKFVGRRRMLSRGAEPIATRNKVSNAVPAIDLFALCEGQNLF